MPNHEQASPARSVSVRMDGPVPVLVLPEALPFEALRAWVRAEVPAHAGRLAGRTIRLDLGERDINLFDLRRLCHLLREEFGTEATGLYVRDQAVRSYAERELKLKLFPTPTEPEVVEAPADADEEPELDLDDDDDTAEVEAAPDPDEDADRIIVPTPDLEGLSAAEVAAGDVGRAHDGSRRTLPVHRTLRSGTSVRFEGDVVVFGDVNPGAQVVAAGNVIVLGHLRGMAHAGALGDEEAFIFGLTIRATQLRVGRRIAIPPDRGSDGAALRPQIAHVVVDRIVIEAYSDGGQSPAPRPSLGGWLSRRSSTPPGAQ